MDILMHVLLLLHVYSSYVQKGPLNTTLVNDICSQMSYAQQMSHSGVIAVGMFQDAYQTCASFRHVHFFIICSTRAYVQNPDSALSHLKPHKHTIHPPLIRPFLPRLPDVQRDSGAEWGGTRATVSPVKAKDLAHPSIPLGSPSNTHIPTKYFKGMSQSPGSNILMLLSGYKLLDFV